MRVDVVHNVLKLNDALAGDIRRKLHELGIVTLNLISSPGSGKTTLLQRTLAHFGGTLKQAVVVGDLATTLDAERMADLAQTVQINTDGGCHLDAAMVSNALEALDLTGVDVLYIENVGNLVCPVGYDLGHDLKVGMLSTPEGEDKIAKYPRLWHEADAVLLNKCDLLPYVGFNRDKFYADLRELNADAPVFEVTATDEASLSLWYDWLTRRREATLSARAPH